MKRPKGTRKKYSERLTKKERKKIAACIIAGDKQVEVAREFGICVETVREVQREFGVSRWRELTPEIEEEILQLLRENIGLHRAVKMSRVPESAVRAIMREHGITHDAAGRRALTAEKRAQIAAAVRRREDYCVRLAEKFHVSRAVVQKIAHQVWGEGRFNSSVWPPMLSVFPQRHFDPKLAGPPDDAEASFIQVVDFIIKHMGERPKDPDQLAQLLLGVCLNYVPKPVLDAFTNIERENVQRYFAAHIAQALNTMRESENCAWKN
jgi:transposase-like protein